MKTWTSVLALLMTMQLVFAENSRKVIQFQGQPHERFELENLLTETRYREKQVDSVCTRQIQTGTREQCDWVTRYRQECRTIPGHQVCRDVVDRVCRNVTRTRRQCSAGPSRRVCERTPSRQQCTRGPSRQQCSRGPSRQVCSTSSDKTVCSNRNGRRVCRKVPGRRTCRTVPGERTCRTIPGERTCRTIPGERICRNVPGPQVCRDVPYTDRVCHNQTRNVCHWEPARQACEQVPYQDRVCRDVPVYKTEEYVCKKTVKEPYVVTLKKFMANVSIDFDDNDVQSSAKLEVELGKDGKIDLQASQLSSNALFTATRKVKRRDNGELLEIDAHYKLKVMDKSILSAIQTPIKKVKVRRNRIKFRLGKTSHPELLAFKIEVKDKKGKELFQKILNAGDLKLDLKEDRTDVELDLKQHGIKLKWLRQYFVYIEVRVRYEGKVLNHPQPVLKQVIDLKKRAGLF